MTSDAEREDVAEPNDEHSNVAEPAVDRPENGQPDVLTEAAEVVAAYEEMVCAVCEKPIESGSQYIPAHYGPVHPEPCSHQGKVV